MENNNLLQQGFIESEAQLKKQKIKIGLFELQTFNACLEEAKNMPIPNMLLSELWYEEEVCILFADTNTGKSVLALQIGDSISKGMAILGLKMEAQRKIVLYLDFELSKKQLEKRCSEEYKNHYTFDEQYIRLTLSTNPELPKGKTFESFLFDSLEEAINVKGAKVVIIDNITYLTDQLEQAKGALPLMKKLKELAVKYKLSMLILAHTPKRDTSKELSANDLHGSKMIMNFCDSSIAIGKSATDENIRYLKQIKERSTSKLYGSNNVMVFKLEQPKNCLQFFFEGFGVERSFLWIPTKMEKEQLKEDIINLKKSNAQLSNREIARQLGTNHKRVGRVLKQLKLNVDESGTHGADGTLY